MLDKLLAALMLAAFLSCQAFAATYTCIAGGCTFSLVAPGGAVLQGSVAPGGFIDAPEGSVVVLHTGAWKRQP